MKIFIVTYGSVHARIAIRMAKEYSKNNIDFAILAMPAAIAQLKESKLPFKTLADYLYLFDNADEILAIGNGLAKVYHNPEMDFEISDTAVYYGFCMCNLIEQYGKEEAEKRFTDIGRKAFSPIEYMKKILLHEKPDVLEVSVDVRVEAAAVCAAKDLGIKSVFILDSYYLVMNTLPISYICVINEDLYNRHLAAGFSKEQLVVTGQPCFENHVTLDKLACKNELFSDFSINKDKPIISWFGHEKDEYVVRIFNELLKIAYEMPNYNFIVKLHPTSQHLSDFDGFEIPSNMYIIDKYSAEKIVCASEVVLNEYSTVGFEALLIDRPLIVINETGMPYSIRYEEKGAAIFVDNIDKLRQCIIDILNNNKGIADKMEKARLYYKSSPAAAENIVKFISGLCK